MSSEQTLLFSLAIILLALIFDFINGFHDTANAVATSIATGALPPRRAILIASAMNFLGALFFTGVAQNIAENIIQPLSVENGLEIIAASLTSASLWNIITWYFGLPSSSSHALIGSMAGAAYAAEGSQGLDISGLGKALEALAFSPPLAFLTGFCLMAFFNFLFYMQILLPSDKRFLFWQRIATVLQSFSHGSNDAQKTMGVITLALIISGYQETFLVPFWVKCASAIAITAGTAAGGWRIIKTVATDITRLTPSSGFVTDFSSALMIMSATILRLPISTTHVVSSAIMGVGITRGRRAVNWSKIAKIFTAWMLTLPSSILTGAFMYQLFFALSKW